MKRSNSRPAPVTSHVLQHREPTPPRGKLPQKRSSSRFAGEKGSELPNLPMLKEVAWDEQQSLAIKKLDLCCHLFDFMSSSFMAEKEKKRATLLELLDFINTRGFKFTPESYAAIAKMFASNLFRCIAPSLNPSAPTVDPEENEPILEIAWPHVQLVYEIFLRFIVSQDIDAKVAVQYINQSFLARLLDLFQSEDPRERDYLKTILHRIYGKLMPMRQFIRRYIKNIFCTFIFEGGQHSGIAELLEILGAIINGFVLPLKNEHKLFFSEALLPLHKAATLSAFHSQLAYCTSQYVDADPDLAVTVIKYLLKVWPVSRASKEILFLTEIEDIVDAVQPKVFVTVMKPLLRKVAHCIASEHFQVAERSLLMWNNEYFSALVAQNRAELLPIFFGALYKNSKAHWNPGVHGLSYNLLNHYMDLDPILVDRCTKNLSLATVERQERMNMQARRWHLVERLAGCNAVAMDVDEKNRYNEGIEGKEVAAVHYPSNVSELKEELAHVGLSPIKAGGKASNAKLLEKARLPIHPDNLNELNAFVSPSMNDNRG